MNPQVEAFIRIMEQEGINEQVIHTFAAYYNKLASGTHGKLSRADIVPVTEQSLAYYDHLDNDASTVILNQAVAIKLNGGLGTSMGLSKAKSLLPVKGNLTFLDIIARQILTLRSQSGFDIPLLFMDSYNTQADTLAYLSKYPDLVKGDIPLDFLQNKFPRICREDLTPFLHKDASQRWNPPGHGDIYAALSSQGLLDKLLDSGIRYAFISNADNLGATLDPTIAAYMLKHEIPFLMEVCERHEVDKKGGHICESMEGRLMLREIAQCPEDELGEFQNVELYKYFNTNNIWLDLVALKTELDRNNGMLLLPIIINPKLVDGLHVLQLETAMGAAISTFEGAKALVVPRSRFAPVKKTTDLLAIWSDAYELNDRYQIVLKRNRKEPPSIELDGRYYSGVEQLKAHFPAVPSLVNCQSLNITGDITFGEDVICEGNVYLIADNPAKVKNRICEGIINV